MNVLFGNFCTGCSLCAQICPHQAIQMESSDEGYLFPVVESSLCTDCGICTKICPVLTGREARSNFTQSVYACQALDKDLLIEATAGGLFPVLSRYILSNGGVVFGAAYDKNMRVVHSPAYSMEQIKSFSGSKYVQSDISAVFSEIRKYLIQQRYVLFSGTPCQVDAINRYCKDISTKKLYTIDVVCYGVPSPKLFRDFLDTLEEKYKKKVTDFRFRDKHTHGWSHTTVITFQNKDGTYESIEEENHTKIPYYKMFGYRDCYRTSCYQCQYNTLQRVSDITTGNFWGIEKISQTFNTALGVSMVILNTEQGRYLFENIKRELTCESHSIDEAIRANEALICGSKETKRRDAIYRYYIKHGFAKMYKKYYTHDWKRGLRMQASNVKQHVMKMLQKGGV